MPKQPSLQKELDLAIELAQKGGEIACQIREKGYDIRQKGGGNNPVTDADEAVSQYIVKKISQTFPKDLVISEEASPNKKNSQASRIWYIDPIDGTKEFIKGNNEWSVMIGLAMNQRPVLGVVYQPDRDWTYYATRDEGAFLLKDHQSTQIHVNPVNDLSKATLIQSRSHKSENISRIARELGINKNLQHGSIGLKLGIMAEGRADLYFNFSRHCHLWDLCASEIILEEAGGRVALADGKRVLYQGMETIIKEPFLASTEKLFDKVSSLLR